MSGVKDGNELQVVVDAYSLPSKLNYVIAFRRMERAGVTFTNTKQTMAELAQNWIT